MPHVTSSAVSACARGNFVAVVKSLTLFLVALIGAGCGGIQRAHYFRPDLADPSVSRRAYGDGLLFKVRNICLAIYEGASAYYIPMAAGPIGLPVFPLGILDMPDYKPATFELVLWIDSDQYSYQLDGTRVQLLNGDGTRVTPDSSTGPRYLWGSSQFVLRFNRPSLEVIPKQLVINGLTRDGDSVALPTVILEEITETRYLISGMTANRVPVGPMKDSCRQLAP